MSRSDQEDDAQEPKYESSCEDLEDYKRDGYHPTYLGETFMNSRYMVLQKLGWGHFSTVWLAEDRQADKPESMSPCKYVALKVQKSKESYSEAAEDEIQILKAMKEAKNSPEWLATREEMKIHNLNLSVDDNYCIEILNNFPHFGMHGKHYCSTFRIMGPNLLDLMRFFEKKYDRGVPIPLVKKITQQLLIGLDYMHRICKVIHTDLKPENVMIDLPEVDLDQFVNELKHLKTLPLSMKYLKLVQSSNKNKKRKKKKKTTEKEATKSDQGGAETDSQSQTDSNMSLPIPKGPDMTLETQPTQDESQAINELDVQGDTFKKNPNVINEEKTTDKSEQDQSKAIDNELDQVKADDVKQQSINSVEIIEPKVKDRIEGEFSRDDDGSSVSSDCGSTGSYFNKKEFVFYWKEKVKVEFNENIRIRIVDFGNACWTFKHYTDNIQTREYRSPEAIVGSKYNESTDLWSVACMVFELLTGDYLFRPQSDRDEPRDEIHLALFMSTLGKLPKKLALEGKYSRDLFNKSGKLLHAKVPEDYTIEQILMSEYKFKESDAKEIREFLMPMLEYDIDKRISAKDALKSPWLWS